MGCSKGWLIQRHKSFDVLWYTYSCWAAKLWHFQSFDKVHQNAIKSIDIGPDPVTKTTFCNTSSDSAVLYTELLLSVLLGFARIYLGMAGFVTVCYRQHDSWQRLDTQKLRCCWKFCKCMNAQLQMVHASQQMKVTGKSDSSKTQPDQQGSMFCEHKLQELLITGKQCSFLILQHASWLKDMFALVQVALAKSHLWLWNTHMESLIVRCMSHDDKPCARTEYPPPRGDDYDRMA